MPKMDKLRGTFLYRMVVQFVFFIVIPFLCSWWILEKVLETYYVNNTLHVQQINMQNCLVFLEKSMAVAQNTLEILAENEDIIYYLEYSSVKQLMPYSAFRRVKSQCEELRKTVPYLETVNIYCDSPLVLYAWPLMSLERYGLEKEIQSLLDEAKLGDTVWGVSFSETKEFPVIYGYRKLYNETFSKCIGYLEIQMSSQLLEDCVQMLLDLMETSGGVLSLYYDDAFIYTTAPGWEIENWNRKPGYELQYFQNRYTQTLQIPELNLYIIVSGTVSDLNEPLKNKFPSLAISIIIISLLLLFVIFFMSIVSLSRRILRFASFIENSDSSNLYAYEVMKKTEYKEDELDVLINTYNSLIQEHNILISRIEKMELFTQMARYNALQHQMHPHFIYGTLETIRVMVLLEQNDEAVDMIYSLSELLRHSIEINDKSVTLREELEVAGYYIGIQKVRFNGRITYIVKVAETLLGLQLPAFILQPILENAIFYGISKTGDSCELIVEARESEADIVLQISNTGELISRERLQEVNRLLADEIDQKDFSGNRNGKALYNIKERLKIFYEGRASMRLALEDNRTVNIITINKG